jgi:hypothetical protein
VSDSIEVIEEIAQSVGSKGSTDVGQKLQFAAAELRALVEIAQSDELTFST